MGAGNQTGTSRRAASTLNPSHLSSRLIVNSTANYTCFDVHVISLTHSCAGLRNLSYINCGCFSFYQLDTNWVTLEEGLTFEKVSLSDWLADKSVEHLTTGAGGSSPLWVVPSLGR